MYRSARNTLHIWKWDWCGCFHRYVQCLSQTISKLQRPNQIEGDRTVFGTIAKLTNEPKTGMTTLEREVLNFVIVICSIMFSMIILVLIVWYVPYFPSRLFNNDP